MISITADLIYKKGFLRNIFANVYLVAYTLHTCFEFNLYQFYVLSN